MDSRIYVVTHKKYSEPKDPLYHTLHVGRALAKDFGYEGDNTGDNISPKNKNYCELTGLYWIWKNVACDIVGICHYRRYFLKNNEILDKNYIESILKDYDIIVPNSGTTPYETNYEHYAQYHVESDWKICEEVLLSKHPEMKDCLTLFNKTNLASLGNMFITKKEIYDKYCSWLFDILFEVEQRVNIESYDDYQARIYGFLSERLFRIWLFANSYKIHEEAVEMVESTRGRLIVFTGLYDTLDIFAYELIRDFKAMSYEVMEFNSQDMTKSLGAMSTFIEKPVTAVITFNNLGYNMELTPGQNTWDVLGMYCINILMDHPVFHKAALDTSPANAIVLCPDKNHMKYIQRFYPNIPITGFLAHGGIAPEITPRPIMERSINILYAGGISTPFIDKSKPDFSQFNFDAKAIADRAYNELITNPYLTSESVIEKLLLAEEIQLTDEELNHTIEQLKYVEMMAVTYFREQTVKVLVDAGIDVTIYGTGWDSCCWIDNPHAHFMGRTSANEIVEKMLDSKIVLNTMTWFKDGTHDRVFNGMLAGALAVTDSSVYMKEEFTEKELVMFELSEIQKLPETIKVFLDNPCKMQAIADAGRAAALKSHTWKSRAEELDRDLLSQLY